MISKRELEGLRAEWAIDLDVIGKDYVLGWLLTGIAQHADLTSTWIFKGGTSLRKCYYETFRFSEDLNFTVIGGGPNEPDDLARIFGEVAEWLYEESGIGLVPDANTFRHKVNRRGKPTTQGKIAYRGPNPPPTLPKVKLDITTDEILVDRPELRLVGHPYSDTPLPGPGVFSYSLIELFGEKLRALAERCRPRDLYDVVHLHRHPDMLGASRAVADVLKRKCEHAGIDVPTLEAIHSSRFRQEIETEWENMLGHQLPKPLPPFESFWADLGGVFAWLDGATPAPQLQRAEIGSLDPSWVAPVAITSWRRGVPVELLRYAGANRLKVEIDYRAESGRWGPRLVEPYALRRTQDGNLVLFVVNDRDQLRAYRVDRIAGIRPTANTFKPKYRVEF